MRQLKATIGSIVGTSTCKGHKRDINFASERVAGPQVGKVKFISHRRCFRLIVHCFLLLDRPDPELTEDNPTVLTTLQSLLGELISDDLATIGKRKVGKDDQFSFSELCKVAPYGQGSRRPWQCVSIIGFCFLLIWNQVGQGAKSNGRQFWNNACSQCTALQHFANVKTRSSHALLSMLN